MKTGATDGRYVPRLFKGSLTKIDEEVEALGFGSPSAIWPTDRSWFSATDWDLECTLVGGSISLIDELDASSAIEMIRVRRDTRIDYRADHANRPD